MIRLSTPPDDPREADPHRFPWGAAVLLVLVLFLLMFVGNRIVEDYAGEAVAVVYVVVAAAVWLLVTLAWLTRKGGGR